jgi:asparagine synthase (glutamine-hydrolysing)
MEQILDKIGHRGPYLSGIHTRNRVTMAQNYLRADLSEEIPEGTKVPVSDSRNADLRICYDGQIGNLEALATAFQVERGPFREERLLLHLYQEQGPNMVQHLDDAIFALVISDGEAFFAARDLLGIKTLFYGRKGQTLYFASELKCLIDVTDDINEFPPGHYMTATGSAVRFAVLPEVPPESTTADLNQITADIRDIIDRSLRNQVDFSVHTASLLSGGMDSSVISYLAAEFKKESLGENARLRTFAVGVDESEDIRSARIMATHIGSDHHELIVDLDEVLAVLPQVIYYLESFDPSLVRSSVCNFLVSRYAREQGAEVLLSGEGGDEIFCGYLYLKQFPPKELFARLMECMSYLHNNAALRLDRMNSCHSVRVVAPLISGELLRYAMSLPPEYQQKPAGEDKVEKWIFRMAYRHILPEAITNREKSEFSQGSGSAALLPAHFEHAISDEELSKAQAQYPLVRTKEELHYFRIFTGYFGDGKAVTTVGQWPYF